MMKSRILLMAKGWSACWRALALGCSVAVAAPALAAVGDQQTDVYLFDSGTSTATGKGSFTPADTGGVVDPSAVSQAAAETIDSELVVTEYAERKLLLVPEAQRFGFSSALLGIDNFSGPGTTFSVRFDSDLNGDGVFDDPIPFGWRLRFCLDDGSGDCPSTATELGPEDATAAERTVGVTVTPGTGDEFLIKLFPSWDSLFNGGTAELNVTVTKDGGDTSVDVAKFTAATERFDAADVVKNPICSPFDPPPPPPQFLDLGITPPFFTETAVQLSDGRQALLVNQSVLTNDEGNTNRRLGDIKLFFADCLLGGFCDTASGESPTDLDSVSLITDTFVGTGTVAVGLGYVLSKMTPSDGDGNNHPDPDLSRKIRRLYYTSKGAPDTTAKDSYALDDFQPDNDGTDANCNVLKGPGFLDVANASWLGDLSDCTGDLTTAGSLDRTKRLISFVRGDTLASSPFPREAQRLVTAGDQFFDPGGADEEMLLGAVPVGDEWLLPDLLGAPPLIIGPPNIFDASPELEGESDYDAWVREDDQQQRAVVLYSLDSDGLLHAFLLERFKKKGFLFQGFDSTFGELNVRELWAYVPKGALPTLKYTVNEDHHRFGNSLLRAHDIQMKSGDKFEPDDFRTVLVGHQGPGGGGIFALDVTDPDDPKLFWDFACEEVPVGINSVNDDCYDDEDLIDQDLFVQGAPVVGRLVDSNNLAKWVVIYASGPRADDYIEDYGSAASWLTVREVQTGELIKRIEVSGKVGNLVTPLIALRDTASGNFKAIYFGDYYGAMWRVRAERIADTIADGSALQATDMLFKPQDYSGNDTAADADRPVTARPRIAADDFNSVWTFFGSGDYVFDLSGTEFGLDDEHQRFYGLKDDPDLTHATFADTAGLVDMTQQTSGAGNVNNDSWFIKLGTAITGGLGGRTINERVLNPAVVFGGLACFNTFQLPEDAARCTDEGIARLYCVDFESARANAATDARLSSSFNQTTAAPVGSPIVLVSKKGKRVPSKIFQGGPLRSLDKDVNQEVDISGRQACQILLWRDRG